MQAGAGGNAGSGERGHHGSGGADGEGGPSNVSSVSTAGVLGTLVVKARLETEWNGTDNVPAGFARRVQQQMVETIRPAWQPVRTCAWPPLRAENCACAIG
jgi:hypothetical protein